MSVQTLVLLMFIACCLVFVANKMIAARIYIRTVEQREGRKSPYGLVPAQAVDKSWGYCITKHGEIYRTDKYSSAPVYSNANYALRELNLLEKLEGYKPTVLDEENK